MKTSSIKALISLIVRKNSLELNLKKGFPKLFGHELCFRIPLTLSLDIVRVSLYRNCFIEQSLQIPAGFFLIILSHELGLCKKKKLKQDHFSSLGMSFQIKKKL